MGITLIIIKFLMEIYYLNLLKSLLEVWLQKIEFHMNRLMKNLKKIIEEIEDLNKMKKMMIHKNHKS